MSLLNELKEHPIRTKEILCLFLLAKATRGRVLIPFVEQQEHACGTHGEDAHVAHTQIFHLLKRRD